MSSFRSVALITVLAMSLGSGASVLLVACGTDQQVSTAGETSPSPSRATTPASTPDESPSIPKSTIHRLDGLSLAAPRSWVEADEPSPDVALALTHTAFDDVPERLVVTRHEGLNPQEFARVATDALAVKDVRVTKTSRAKVAGQQAQETRGRHRSPGIHERFVQFAVYDTEVSWVLTFSSNANQTRPNPIKRVRQIINSVELGTRDS